MTLEEFKKNVPVWCWIYKPMLIPSAVILLSAATSLIWKFPESLDSRMLISHSFIIGGLSINIWMLVQMIEDKTINQKIHLTYLTVCNELKEQIEKDKNEEIKNLITNSGKLDDKYVYDNREEIRDKILYIFRLTKKSSLEGATIVILFIIYLLIFIFSFIIVLKGGNYSHIGIISATFLFGIVIPVMSMGGNLSASFL